MHAGGASNATLGSVLRAAATRRPDGVAVLSDRSRWTCRELDRRSDGWAAWLRGGIGAGERVATVCRTCPEQIALLHGCARAGTILTPLSHRLGPAELAHQLDDAAPAVLLHDAEFADLAFAAARLAGHPPRLAALDQSAVPSDSRGLDEPGDPEAVVLLVFTSGSSGRPRGVPLSHRNCLATGDALDGVARLGPADVVLQVLPQHHAGGWTVLPLLALARGATLVVEGAFDPDRVLGLIERHRVTVTMGVPAMYRMMADRPAFATTELGSLRLAIAGGAALPAALLRRWLDRGVPLCQGYGLTEAGPNVLCVPPSEVDGSAGWAGPPYPGVEVVLDDGGHVDGPGRGELLVRGPGVFRGYWGRADGPGLGGWLRSGDLAERDGRGWYRILDRLDDLYVSGGENVAPAEVEAVLVTHPAVAEAAVVGAPDAVWGQVGVAFVVPVEGSTVDGDEVRAHCRERLAGFKVPARVVAVERLPVAGLGKVRRDALRAMVGGVTDGEAR
jgi:fatty-acyl-CoA synthase